MSTWTTALGVGFVTALRFVALPSFGMLVLFSLGWRGRTGRWLPLWKLGVVLLAATALGTLAFAVAWQDQVGKL